MGDEWSTSLYMADIYLHISYLFVSLFCCSYCYDPISLELFDKGYLGCNVFFWNMYKHLTIALLTVSLLLGACICHSACIVIGP
jgi:hypothetical protein